MHPAWLCCASSTDGGVCLRRRALPGGRLGSRNGALISRRALRARAGITARALRRRLRDRLRQRGLDRLAAFPAGEPLHDVATPAEAVLAHVLDEVLLGVL